MSLQAQIYTGITSEPNSSTHTIASLFFPHWFLHAQFIMADVSDSKAIKMAMNESNNMDV